MSVLPLALTNRIEPLRDRLRRLNVARRRAGIGIPAWIYSPGLRLFVLLTLSLVGLIAAGAWAFSYTAPQSPGREIPLGALIAAIPHHQVISAVIDDEDQRVIGRMYTDPPAEGHVPGGASFQYWTQLDSQGSETPILTATLAAEGVNARIRHDYPKEVVHFLLQFILPLVILANLFGLIFLLARGGGGGGVGGVVAFGRIGGKRRKGGDRRLTFADIGGAETPLAELREVKDYLTDPARFTAMGALPPKGVLLVGPPGCGKTLMARAVAGEADVPFFSISGAEFVESLVGVGAARVRDLFRQVRLASPAILFIDEIDAAGRRRGGSTGGQEEREQTLNQLLVEMDGFDPTAGVVVMGATNRPDILDPALLRPGRFDRQVTVEPPDVEGRQQILELHAGSRPVAGDVDFDILARRTPGFTGADLANVVNEAALLAVRFGRVELGMEEFEEAVQRTLTGPQRRGHLLTADERKRAAFHEAGHAVVSAALGRLDGVQRVSIIARGRSLGEAAMGRSMRDRSLLSRTELVAELVCTLAGVAAEEIVLGELSTGGENDLERANVLAESITGRYGMSENLGKLVFIRTDGDEFLGGSSVPRDLTTGPVLMEMHHEVRRIIDEAEGRAQAILMRHRTLLNHVAAELEERESLDSAELESMLEPVRPEMNLRLGES